MLEICGNLAHLFIYQNVRVENEKNFLILGRKIVAFWKPWSSHFYNFLTRDFISVRLDMSVAVEFN